MKACMIWRRSSAWTLESRLGELYHDQASFRGSHPLDEIDGLDAIATTVWQPLLQAFPDLERRDLIFVGGSYDERDYVAAMGHYCGTFRPRFSDDSRDRPADLSPLWRSASGRRR